MFAKSQGLEDVVDFQTEAMFTLLRRVGKLEQWYPGAGSTTQTLLYITLEPWKINHFAAIYAEKYSNLPFAISFYSLVEKFHVDSQLHVHL